MITSDQIRAARAMLKWSSKDLSEASGIGIATIKRFELMQGVPNGNVKTVISLQNALENAGVEFIGSPENSPGVRLKNTRITP